MAKHSTAGSKPSKPYPDFPLFPHRNGRWCKKVRGRHAYFTKIADDPKGDGALALWLDQKDALLAGRTPRTDPEGLTVRDLCNAFLTAKQGQRDAGDIASRSFDDYYRSAEIVLAAFGKSRLVDDLTAADFDALRRQLAKTRNPGTLGNEVQRIRTLFKFAYDAGLVDKPVRVGPTFKRPAKRILRAVRQAKPPKMFEPHDIHQLLDAANDHLRAMILLGVNCGFGNTDCGTLPISAIDFAGGWIEHPRPKTAIERRCPIWPETAEALRVAIAGRPEPKDPQHDGLAFLTRRGLPWAKNAADSPVTKEFRKLLDKLKLHKPGLGFYTLRHVFETIAGESRDQVAVNAIMGHADSSMSAHYRERISDDRLRDAVNTVRSWLYPKRRKAK